MWAQTQEKLALVQLAYFKKNREPGHLDEALENVGGALEEYRKAKAAFYLERAERVRARILASRTGKF
jgi:hypothetical protein